ncbi:MAG: hypothetical protein AAFO87_16360 [Cyanobacteria bacterium J06607_6]
MASFINQLGQLNPQYIRECRGRLKPRSVVAAIVLSLLFQGLLWLSIINSYSRPDDPSDVLKLCRALSAVIPYALFALGGYYIVDDLTQEAKTGTLNFIRLSPRPAREILFGKLLGVPALPMVLVAAMLPAHIISGLSAGISPWLLLSYYLVVSAGALTVFMLALLVGLGSGNAKLTQQRGVSAIAFAGINLFSIVPAFTAWNTAITWQTIPTNTLLFRDWGPTEEDAIHWMFLNISQNALFAHLFVLGNLAMIAALIWRTAIRKFRVPQATLLSRPTSYLITIYINLAAWGFVFDIPADERYYLAAFLYFVNVMLLFTMMFALSPSRQQLLDWTSHRTQAAISSGQPARSAQAHRGLWQSLVWSDVSPSVGAIAVNFLLSAVLIVPALYLFGQGRTYYNNEPIPNVTLIALLFATLVIALSVLTYATLVQVIFASKLRAPLVWAVGSAATLAIVPVLTLVFLEMAPDDSPMLSAIWTFLGIPMVETVASEIPPLAWIGVIGQVCFLALLLGRLNQTLKQLKSHSTRTRAEQTLSPTNA